MLKQQQTDIYVLVCNLNLKFSNCLLMDMEHFDIPGVKCLFMKTPVSLNMKLDPPSCYTILYSSHKWRVATFAVFSSIGPDNYSDFI
jgi:hypothetical protein